jgi:hypothetical protein
VPKFGNKYPKSPKRTPTERSVFRLCADQQVAGRRQPARSQDKWHSLAGLQRNAACERVPLREHLYHSDAVKKGARPNIFWCLRSLVAALLLARLRWQVLTSGQSMQGGMVLSEAVKQSGILAVVANSIEHASHGMPLWTITAVFSAFVLVCTTFVSHTVGAMVILPIVESVGNALPDPHPRLLVMATALMCSGAMGLPVSGVSCSVPAASC